MSSRLVFLLLAIRILYVVEAQNQLCYAPDGVTTSLQSGYAWKPCINVGGIHSMCCATNRTDSTVDTCLTNGLCTSQGSFWRDFCTDMTWQSPNCLPKTCADPSNPQSMSHTAKMTQCSDGTFCCGANNTTDCCAKSLGFQLPVLPIFQATASSISSNSSDSSPSSSNTAATSPSPTSNPTQTPNSIASPSSKSNTTSNPTQTPNANASPSSKSNTTAEIAIGVSLGVIAIAGSMLAFWLGQRRGISLGEKKAQVAGNERAKFEENVATFANTPLGDYTISPQQMKVGNDEHVRGLVHEVDDSREPAELGNGRM